MLKQQIDPREINATIAIHALGLRWHTQKFDKKVSWEETDLTQTIILLDPNEAGKHFRVATKKEVETLNKHAKWDQHVPDYYHNMHLLIEALGQLDFNYPQFAGLYDAKIEDYLKDEPKEYRYLTVTTSPRLIAKTLFSVCKDLSIINKQKTQKVKLAS